MSQANLDLGRRAVQAMNDRDFATLGSIFSEDIVWRLIGGFADLMGTEFRGRDAVLTFLREVFDTLDARGEIEAIREVHDQVVMVVNTVGAGSASGAPASIRPGYVLSFRGGCISAVDGYYSADEALTAAGLPG
jgi:ketosteroid isomerase-like protein